MAQAILRSPTVLFASVFLWGMNVYFFRLFKLDYVRILTLDLVKEREQESRNKIPKVPSAEMEEAAQNDDELMITGKSSELGENQDYQDEVLKDDFAEKFDDGNAITWGKLIQFSIALMFLLHLTIYLWIEVCGGGAIGALFCFYGAVGLGIAFPLPTTRWLRRACVIVLQRAWELIRPRCSCVSPDPKGPRPIPFIDVFFADAMCSLSKVFFDWGMLLHLISHYPERVPKSTHSILIPSICAAIPYIIRARQCLIMYTVGRIKRDPKRYQHILNAIKYSTSIFPLCLSAYQQTIESERAEKLEGFLIALLTINALYALTWDIVMDWGMMQNPSAVMEHTCMSSSLEVSSVDDVRPPTCGHAVLRPRLRFGLAVSAGILLADSVLRFSWLLRFWQALFPSKDVFVLATQFLEVFRRAIWNLLRVEWEHIKQANHAKSNKSESEMEFFIRPPVSQTLSPITMSPKIHGHKC